MTAVKLVGLDFGTTTSSAVIASADLVRNAVTGKTDLSCVHDHFRSELMFTPWRDEQLDIEAIEQSINNWLHAGGVRRDELFGGGALLTGLAAQAENAALLVKSVRHFLGDAFIATADDPCLESWLAFHGSCGAWSRAHPDTPVLNLDIGGGTTNAALGQAGNVLATGCLFVGARHVQVRPGSHEITRLSSYARALFEDLGIAKDIGNSLTASEVTGIASRQVSWLEAMVSGRREAFTDRVGHLHEQVPLRLPPDVAAPLVTLSGGVGELVYARIQGRAWPSTTAFGDLGIELAWHLLEASPWGEHFHKVTPASCGRATVYGLLQNSTQISGSTLFLPRADYLPLTDLPILGHIGVYSSEPQLINLLEMVRQCPRGGGLTVDLEKIDADTLRSFGERLAQRLEELTFRPDQPLVLFVTQNCGKVLGQLVTRWGHLPLRLVVVDEIDIRDAQYVHLGAMREQIIPVSVFRLKR